MEVFFNKSEPQVTVEVHGRVDSSTAPELETAIAPLFDGVTTMIFDCSHLEYLSSAGLRVLHGAQKKLSTVGGEVCLQHVGKAVMEVLEITGMANVFTIKA